MQKEFVAAGKDADAVFLQVQLRAQIAKTEIGGYVSYCPVLDLYSQGKTVKEAKNNITEAVRLLIEDCVEQGILNEVLSDGGFRLAGDKTKRRRKSSAEMTGRVVNIPAKIPMAAAGTEI